MPDTNNIFACQGGEMTAYRLIWGHFNGAVARCSRLFPQSANARGVKCCEHSTSSDFRLWPRDHWRQGHEDRFSVAAGLQAELGATII